MAEAAAVASIVGIASFGIQLTQALYEFGSNVASVREETGYIARHVDLYANVLDILTERIDDDEPILSDAAFDLIDELKYQSRQIFTQIEKALPTPAPGKDDISFLQKVKWNFTKPKVALLVGELDYLRSTVHLLVTIIFTGKTIRSRRKRRKLATSSTACRDLDLQEQEIKAQNALLAQIQAQDKLPKLEDEAAEQEARLNLTPSVTRTDLICTNTSAALTNLQQSLVAYVDQTERQRAVLQQSGSIFQQLLQQWTTVDVPPHTDASQPGIFPLSGTHDGVREREPSSHDIQARNTGLPSHFKSQDSNRNASTVTLTSDFEGRSPIRKVSDTPAPENVATQDNRNRASKDFDDIVSQTQELRTLLELWHQPEKLPPGWTKSFNFRLKKYQYFDRGVTITPSFESDIERFYPERWEKRWNQESSRFEYYEEIKPWNRDSVRRYEFFLTAIYPSGWERRWVPEWFNHAYFDSLNRAIPMRIPIRPEFFESQTLSAQGVGLASTEINTPIPTRARPTVRQTESSPSLFPPTHLSSQDRRSTRSKTSVLEGKKPRERESKTSQNALWSDPKRSERRTGEQKYGVLCSACNDTGSVHRRAFIKCPSCIGMQERLDVWEFEKDAARRRCKKCEGMGSVREEYAVKCRNCDIGFGIAKLSN